jgi:hypothetical protein
MSRRPPRLGPSTPGYASGARGRQDFTRVHATSRDDPEGRMHDGNLRKSLAPVGFLLTLFELRVLTILRLERGQELAHLRRHRLLFGFGGLHFSTQATHRAFGHTWVIGRSQPGLSRRVRGFSSSAHVRSTCDR